MAYQVVARATRAGFSRFLPAMIARLKALWGAMPQSAKVATVTAASTALGVAVTGNSEDLGPVLAAAAERDVDENVNMMAAIIGAVPEGVKAQMMNAVQSGGPEGQAVALAIEAARARVSATSFTGDGKTASDAQALAYDAVVARIMIIRRALAALGTSNPADLRALRDALFMDEQEFASALARC